MYPATLQSLGSSIRQLRRQHSMTQTELGCELFSKSYVSAVERGKIVPSYEAMRYFSERLEQPRDYFETIFHQQEQMNAQDDSYEDESLVALESQSSHHALSNAEAGALQENFLRLLDTVMAHAELYSFASQHFDLPEDITQIVTLLPMPFQGRFSFLRGLQEMQHGNTVASISALERALTLAPVEYHPAILDALGTNYYISKDYYVALNYHQRALHLLNEQQATMMDGEKIDALSSDGIVDLDHQRGRNNSFPHLLLLIHVHCGDDCSALGAHQQAINFYEQAYQLLSTQVDVQTVGHLLLRLGYSIYASTYQHLSSASPEVIENGLQRAMSFLVQSRMVYQAGSDIKKECQVRLSQVHVLLDLSNWRRQRVQQKARLADETTSINVNYQSLLDDVVKQCHQVILHWHSKREETSLLLDTEIEIYLYSAVAHIIRASVYRVMAAQLGGYSNTQMRELSIAIHYCQQLLDSLSEETFPWSLTYEVSAQQQHQIRYESQPLPKIPAKSSKRHSLSQAHTYFVAALLLDAMGQNAENVDYINEAYRRSDECIRRTLDAMQAAYQAKLVDVSYVVRYYQYCTQLLEEREVSAEKQGIQIDGTLRNMLKDGLQKLTLPLL